MSERRRSHRTGPWPARGHQVLDLGANVGLTTCYLADRFPEANIFPVEASPASYELRKENARRNIPTTRRRHAAVTATAALLRVREGHCSGITRVEHDGPYVEGATMEGRTISDLLDEAGWESVDLLKLGLTSGPRRPRREREPVRTWASVRTGAPRAARGHLQSLRQRRRHRRGRSPDGHEQDWRRRGGPVRPGPRRTVRRVRSPS